MKSSGPLLYADVNKNETIPQWDMKKTNNYFINFSLIMSGNDKNSAIKLNKINENLKNFSLQISLGELHSFESCWYGDKKSEFQFQNCDFQRKKFLIFLWIMAFSCFFQFFSSSKYL